MTFVSLPSLLLLALGFLAALTVLPGIALKAIAAIRRLRGRRAASPPVLGPLFWHELVTVTRRGSQFRLRMAYALLLLAGLLAAFLREFSDANPIRLLFGPGGEFPRERVTAFAERYFHIFLFCQIIALTLVTPVFAGGSITEEKDRGTLQFLQGSLLSNREIVLGKLAARVVFVLGLALTGLPVLAITMLFGGVDPNVLATSFVAATMSTVSLAAYSFWQATRKDTLKAVLFAAYPFVWTLLIAGACCVSCTGGWGTIFAVSPFSLLFASIAPRSLRAFDPIEATMLHVAIHGLLAMLFSVLAMGNVRAIVLPRSVPDRPPGPRWVEVATEPVSIPVESEPFRRDRPPPRFVRVPPVDDDQPFLWKELHFGGRLPSFEMDALRGCGLALLVATLLPVAFGVFATAASTDRPQDVLNPFFLLASTAMVAFIVPLAGVRAVGCVAYERQRQTLDSLFALPYDRHVFLEAKAWAALQWLQYWAFGYAAIAILTLLTGGVGIDGGIVVAFGIASAVPFFLALAIWLSVRCVTVVRAATWYLAIAFGAYLLPSMLAVLVGGAVELLDGSPRFFNAMTGALSLPFGLVAVGGKPGDRPEPEWTGALIGTLAVGFGFLSLSIILWRAALRRFEREGK
jgi:ABC-type transport system involved in multi-copper enzyme maturation permease subunit